MKINFTTKERAALRSKAQTLEPVVMVGHEGITDNVVSALVEALKCHQLVKVKFQAFKEDVRPLSLKLEKLANTTLVSTTGFTAVFFTPEEEK